MRAPRVFNSIMSHSHLPDGKITLLTEALPRKCMSTCFWKGKLIAVVRIVNPLGRMSRNIIRPWQRTQSTLPFQQIKSKNPLPSSSSETNTTSRTFGTSCLNPSFNKLPFLHFCRNGRWRSVYKYNPHTSTLKGTVTITVHYYEDGNVLLTTDHPVSKSDVTGAPALVKAIAEDEKAYQEELNRTFTGLGDGVFKGLRRLLPVTKQKIEWERVATYKVKPGQK